MKQPTVTNILLYFFLGTVLTVTIISCVKEKSCEGCREINKPPIAIAGPDQVIILPTDSIQIDGSASNDPDGAVKSWSWKKISGPAMFYIVNSDVAKTVVKKLDTGIYKFELTVLDDGGLAAKDTVQITVNSRIQTNRPPVANAGPDQVITMPTNAVSVSGSASTDPDNNIASYTWRKISGPSSFSISSPNEVQTQIIGLIDGVYQFELNVTDSAGLFSKDSILVTVQKSQLRDSCVSTSRAQVNAVLVPVGTLAEQPWAVASVDNKVVFVNSKSMEVYDPAVNSWSRVDLKLSTPKGLFSTSVVGAGSKIFFAGGEDGAVLYNVVDIYDFSTNTWSASKLSREGDAFSTVVCGNKVFFAGGNQGVYVTNKVDIYDLSTGIWSSASLSTPRNFITAFASSEKVYFTGGDPWTGTLSNVIDIYNSTTNSWSTAAMQIPRVYHAGTIVDDVIYLAGGFQLYGSVSCSVETLNTITGERSLMNLFGPAQWIVNQGHTVGLKNHQIIFLRLQGLDADKFDIYDTKSGVWSIGILNQSIPEGALMIKVNNTVFIAGGNQNNQVWKLDY